MNKRGPHASFVIRTVAPHPLAAPRCTTVIEEPGSEKQQLLVILLLYTMNCPRTKSPHTAFLVPVVAPHTLVCCSTVIVIPFPGLEKQTLLVVILLLYTMNRLRTKRSLCYSAQYAALMRQVDAVRSKVSVVVKCRTVIVLLCPSYHWSSLSSMHAAWWGCQQGEHQSSNLPIRSTLV